MSSSLLLLVLLALKVCSRGYKRVRACPKSLVERVNGCRELGCCSAVCSGRALIGSGFDEFFFHASHETPCFPLAYKKERRAFHKGHRNTLHQLGLEPIKPRTDQNTQAHSQEATKLLAPVHSSHQRLGTCPSLDRL